MLTARQWLEQHTDLTANPLTLEEEARLADGEVLWDRVNPVIGDGGIQEAFITESGIRIIPEHVLDQYTAARNALADPTDPIALAQIRADLGLRSDTIAEEIEFDQIVAGEAPAPQPCTFEPTAELATRCAPPAGEQCKVTCNLLVTSKGAEHKTVDWTGSFKMRDGSGVKKSTDEWNADRQSHMTYAYSCFATGCENRTWSANVSPTNHGDGTLSATVSAATRWPVLDSSRYTGCSAEAEAGASQTSLVLSHNTHDCNPAQRLPSTAQSLKIRYVVNSETKFSSGTEANGSFNINYKGNITQATANAANLTATGNGLDGLKVDGVGVQANQNNNTTAEVNAGAASAASFRWASNTNGSYASGSDTLSFLNQVQGPPSLNLTNACPQKSVAYKYDLVGLVARVELSSVTLIGGGDDPFCSGSIKAQLPGVPAKIPFDCVYSVQGSTDTHSCVGTVKVNP